MKIIATFLIISMAAPAQEYENERDAKNFLRYLNSSMYSQVYWFSAHIDQNIHFRRKTRQFSDFEPTNVGPETTLSEPYREESSRELKEALRENFLRF